MTFRGTVLFTGGTGYLGGYMSRTLADSGWRVRHMGRRESGACRWQLGETPDSSVFEDVEMLVHAAYDTALTDRGEIERINVQGTRAVFEAAADRGVQRFILISSIAAFPGCVSDYGRAKLECEAIAGDYPSLIIRPGLVYGEESGGVYRAMESWVAKLPVVPVLTPAPDLYLCHVQDLAALVAVLVDRESWSAAVYTAAEPLPVDMKCLIHLMQKRQGVRKPLLPVPWRLPWLACKAMELVGLTPPFRSDGLVGLMRGNPAPDFAATDELPMQFRRYDATETSV